MEVSLSKKSDYNKHHRVYGDLVGNFESGIETRAYIHSNEGVGTIF